MKFVATQSAILRSLMLVFGGISKTGENSMVKIIADANLGSITFETKNLDIKIKSFLKTEVPVSGEISVEFIKLIEVIKKLSTVGEISFDTKDLTFYIKHGKSKFSIKGVEPSELNQDAEPSAVASFDIMSKKVLSLIDKTKFSIFPDETRFNLNGIMFQFKLIEGQSCLTAVSTDGHRLSFCSLEVGGSDLENFPKIILPKKTTLELRKILDTAEDQEIEFNILEKQVILKSESFYFTSKLIDAEFPEYDKVIPKENTKTSSIHRKDLISLIERVSAIHIGSSENSVNLAFSSNLLTITARNKDTGDAIDEIPTESNFSETISVNYNYTYLLEILSHISSENVTFYLKDERTPAILRDDKMNSYFYILMPMRF